MNENPSFDLINTPLHDGVTLIEASAGTGKTFTIAGLFLRLMLETGLSVREILVVTYTEAATEELRDRIRRVLVAAARDLRAGYSEDPLIRKYLSDGAPDHPLTPALSPSEGEREIGLARRRSGDVADEDAVHPASALVDRLERAICSFDEAPIFTIHGFCQRMLKDRAFESGSLFDMELVTDDTSLLQAVTDDFWRTHFYEASVPVTAVLLHHRLEPANLLPLLRKQNQHPELRIVSVVQDQTLAELTETLRGKFLLTSQAWRANKAEIERLINGRWGKEAYAKSEEVAEALAAARQCFEAEEPTSDSWRAVQFFSRSTMEEHTRKDSFTPVHEFFVMCEALAESGRQFLIGVKQEFLAFAKKALPARKQERKQQCFDDLLQQLHRALLGSSGMALAREVQAKYQAALIDEFQDTDPVQYQIFRRLFHPDGGSVGTTSRLFLIGDPKQAIYGFRGADIFTYLEAAAQVHHRYTLGKNWRSEEGLVQAVNTLFSKSDNPFLFGDIRFQPVLAAGRGDKEPLTENGKGIAPFHFWFVPPDKDGKQIGKQEAEQRLSGIVAAEISRLLNGDACIGERRLGPKDIAVLVPENRQARLMQDALRELNVPSVLHTEESVFASHEARELSVLLNAIAQPTNEPLLRAALATDLLGLNGAALEGLIRDEPAWQGWLESFREAHHLWLETGFMAMFRRWLETHSVRSRLLRFSDGERRLTNVLHLAEALHQIGQERRLGIAALTRWLTEQIHELEGISEEHQLRLERDDEAVRLVTIHKSKGLEYPVVFCPFSWRSADSSRARRKREDLFFHEVSEAKAVENNSGELHPLRMSLRASSPHPSPPLGVEERVPEGRERRFLTSTLSPTGARVAAYVLDLGSEDYEAHRRIALREKLAEHLRLLYVALTRAKNRCYFVWGALAGANFSAPAWILHPPSAVGEDLAESMNAHFSARLPQLRRDLESLGVMGSPSDQPPLFEIRDVPLDGDRSGRGLPFVSRFADSSDLKPREFTRTIPRNWRITSFSMLAAGAHEEAPDYDSADVVVPPVNVNVTPASGIFAFPRGMTAGTCLHKIFEEVDFPESDKAALEELVRKKLRAFGFSAEDHMEAVREAIRGTLDVPLDPDLKELRLSRVNSNERLVELEFYLPVQQLTPALLRTGLGGPLSPPEFADALERLGFIPSEGFLKGYIDLVFRLDGRFYLVDWKSNWLGNRTEDYTTEALSRVMAQKLYGLQYHLYTVALHQYLSARLADYDYDRHFGGVFYLFIRGIDPARPEFGVFRDRPSKALIERFSNLLLARGSGGIA